MTLYVTSPLLRKNFGVKLQYWHLGKSSVSKEEVHLEFSCYRLESATQLNSRSSLKLCSQHSIKTSVLCPWEALKNPSHREFLECKYYSLIRVLVICKNTRMSQFPSQVKGGDTVRASNRMDVSSKP